jgi:hypothetical protein
MRVLFCPEALHTEMSLKANVLVSAADGSVPLPTSVSSFCSGNAR